jgi:hypothetical protein
MLQRFDLAIDLDTNRLSIDEYAVLERRYRMREDIVPTKDKYYRVYSGTYDCNTIRKASQKSRAALISALRCEGFFPVSDCAEQLAAKVADLFADDDQQFVQLFYDDRSTILPEEVEAEDVL